MLLGKTVFQSLILKHVGYGLSRSDCLVGQGGEGSWEKRAKIAQKSRHVRKLVELVSRQVMATFLFSTMHYPVPWLCLV